MNPFDESALACALSVKNAKVTLVSMAPYDDKEKLAYYSRLGCEVVLISDKLYAGSDTLATAKILTRFLKSVSPDCVFCGRKSFAGDTAQVPLQVAELMSYRFIPYVMSFSGNSIKTRLGEFAFTPRSVLTFERISELPKASIFSKAKDVSVVDNSVLKLNENEIGLPGSFTKVIKVIEKEKPFRKCKYIKFDDLEGVIRESLNKRDVSAVISAKSDKTEKLDIVHFVGEETEPIAKSLAEKTVRINDVSEIAENDDVKVLLFPAGLNYSVKASMLAARLNTGLAADCINLYVKNGKPVMVRPALSGNTIAEVVSCGKIQMATCRIKETSGKVVFGIGYGAKDSINEIYALAKKYNAEIVATRKVVDNGLLPYEMQAGLTGKIIEPKVYVAFGISGAVQHLVGIERAETVIAINKNKEENIFGNADYGVVKEL